MNKVFIMIFLHGISYGPISYEKKAIWNTSTFKEFLNFTQKLTTWWLEITKDKKLPLKKVANS